ncbi:LysM peptidoglycan-binding domain-containing protein [Cohnella cellulosilytica]|uniref:LysM peptidoglycan-binding domain-containing protein n=1 Tax=Cohnella cellulosilytica TaxID=986710 RepID=A0ABW2FAT5_9BACL
MTDQLNGLRFDIYERVHLPDDVAAIEELEEIELVPHMQALPQDDQVLLRGHLLLSGVYRAQGGSGLSQLEHWIPVEIGLPLNRIQSVEELAVEIDNFDVDLLTTRSLNVTGVLALRGLQLQSAQSPIWRDDSFTVVHQAQPEDDEDAAQLRSAGELALENGVEREAAGADAAQSLAAEGPAEQERVDEWGLQQETDAALAYEASKEAKEAKESSWLSMFQHLEESRSDQADALQEKIAEASPDPAGETVQWGDLSNGRIAAEEQLADAGADGSSLEANGAEAGIPADSAPETAAEPPAAEEKPDLRVALGGKPLESPAEYPSSGVGLLSQLGEKGAKREAQLRDQEAAAQAAEQLAQSANTPAQGSTGDEIEWTRLFLNSGSEGQSFRKVRMCIVQREETLESIATRYNLQTRELQLYNRLQEPYLSEGQVLYIP